MEQAHSLATPARLHAVGVIGFAPTVLAYTSYPAGAPYATRPAMKRPPNPSIQRVAGYQKPIQSH